MKEFDRLKMKNTGTIDEFGGKLAEISSKSAVLGVNIEESKLVKKNPQNTPSQEVYTYCGFTRTSARS